MNVAIIPARGGSKRIQDKNIKPFLGKPIIAYSIEAAKESKLFDKIIISTDSVRIAKIAKEYGAEVPFYRPQELAYDHVSILSVLVHALNWFAEHGSPAKYVCCILATAPFILPKHIIRGFKTLREKAVSSVWPVTTFPFPIFKAFKLEEDGHLEWLWPDYKTIPSNDLPEVYHDAAQFYWMNCEVFLKEQTMIMSDTLPIILPRYMVQDINTREDWKAAERMYKAINK